MQSIVFAEEQFQIVQLNTDRSHVNSGDFFVIQVIYSVTDNNNKLQGIGFNIHYNSEYFESVEIENFYEYSVIGDPLVASESVSDDDSDPETDARIALGWASVGSPSWPWISLPVQLMRIKFTVKDNLGYKTTHFNITKNSNDFRYSFKGCSYYITMNKSLTSDINNDNQVDTVDAILLLQHFSKIY
ncbi:MAG: hypothetical protein HQK75_17525 [Candidatus Magnetomorum sp.]|nr:hypothetical protein [Candidatus Magnetomorum sp.]